MLTRPTKASCNSLKPPRSLRSPRRVFLELRPAHVPTMGSGATFVPLNEELLGLLLLRRPAIEQLEPVEKALQVGRAGQPHGATAAAITAPHLLSSRLWWRRPNVAPLIPQGLHHGNCFPAT